MFSKVKAYWNSLPSWAKGCLFIGAAAASGAVKKYFETPNPCLSLHCLGVLGLSALHVSGIATVGWLMRSPIVQAEIAQLEATPQASAQK